jgi:Carboxypeptidase regulatory-like domain
MIPSLRRFPITGAFLAAAICAVSAVDLRAATVKGTVRSSLSVALQAMTVAAYDATGSVVASATTDANGRYSMTVSAGQRRVLAFDPAGTYATAFGSDADSFETSPVLNLSASDTATVDFQLQLAGYVLGTAFVANASAPGITVAAYNLSGTRRGFTKTNATGSYTLPLPSGSFKLAAYDDAGNLAPVFYSAKGSFEDATAVTVKAPQVNAGIDFILSAAAFLPGAVTDRATGAPLPSINVYAYTSAGSFIASTTTNPSGRFQIAVPAGQYRIVAADPGGTYATAFAGDATSFEKSSVVTVSAGTSAADTLIVMDFGGSVSGRVADAAGNAVPSARVASYNLDGSMRSEVTADASGVYRLVLPTGSFKIAAWDDKLVYVPQFYQQQSDFAGATPIAVKTGLISPGFDFALTRAGRFTGNVTDAGTGAPLAGVTVAAYGPELSEIASAVTDSNGQYGIAVSPATYKLVAWDAAHTFANSFDGGAANFEATAPRTVAASETQVANFTMRRGIAVTGRVTTAAAAPTGGIEIMALDTSGNHVAGTVSGDDGSFVVTLLPGSYKIYVSDPAQRYSSAYYDRASGIASAAIIVVPSSGPPAPLSIVLSSAGRRRSVGH